MYESYCFSSAHNENATHGYLSNPVIWSGYISTISTLLIVIINSRNHSNGQKFTKSY